MVELRCLGEMRARAKERVGANVSGASGSEADWCADLWLGRETIRVKPDTGWPRLASSNPQALPRGGAASSGPSLLTGGV